MELPIKTTTETTVKESVKLTGSTIWRLVQQHIAETTGEHSNPTSVSVIFQVPGGGDYSNMSLDLIADSSLTVDVVLTFSKTDNG